MLQNEKFKNYKYVNSDIFVCNSKGVLITSYFFSLVKLMLVKDMFEFKIAVQSSEYNQDPNV